MFLVSSNCSCCLQVHTTRCLQCRRSSSCPSPSSLPPFLPFLPFLPSFFFPSRSNNHTTLPEERRGSAAAGSMCGEVQAVSDLVRQACGEVFEAGERFAWEKCCLLQAHWRSRRSACSPMVLPSLFLFQENKCPRPRPWSHGSFDAGACLEPPWDAYMSIQQTLGMKPMSESHVLLRAQVVVGRYKSQPGSRSRSSRSSFLPSPNPEPKQVCFCSVNRASLEGAICPAGAQAGSR